MSETKYTPEQAREFAEHIADWQPEGYERTCEVIHSLADQAEELQAQLTELRLQKIAEFGELQDAPVVPAPVPRVPPADMLVNGGALQMVLNILRRGTPVQQEAAEELAKTAAPVAQLSEPPDGWKLVPIAFVQGFSTLAHNYSLNAEAPDYYHGVERDAFSNAYARCGQDLAELRDLLAAAPTTPKGEK